uniref:Uncharacterized protein n=1 Tax=Helicotheca tamesis TaxID=374047 RepID=A0A7S2E2I1_9STRA|eukprot:CAMPEP_0185729876 /NCGR_PEP_ID=MMETSP1171-20130828/7658_1 /TAXON_ID=374046 /ORGANISM="Helicotheca tamensis, Strain CCMP826" /LENGTH=225 /DNA_ID=CAMNT_0028398811 /DNA_START=53 /DNA_END=730 /DNA_ORIENTATION=+
MLEAPLLDEKSNATTSNDDTSGGPWWLTGDEPPEQTARRTKQWGDDDYNINNIPPSRAEFQEGEEEEIPNSVLYTMRLMNMGVAVALMICMLYTSALSISFTVLSSYLTIAGILICCIELDLSFLRATLSLNFGFTHSPILRFFFYMLLSIIPWSYKNLVGRVVSLSILVVGVANVYMLCRYPGYRRERERIAKEEEERMEETLKREIRGRMVRRIAEDGGQVFL